MVPVALTRKDELPSGVVADVVTVSVAFRPPVTIAGLKNTLAPVGRFETGKLTLSQ